MTERSHVHTHQTFEEGQVTHAGACISLEGCWGSAESLGGWEMPSLAAHSGVVLAVSCWQRWRPSMYLPFTNEFQADTVLFKTG